jgi:hypothetical protein
MSDISLQVENGKVVAYDQQGNKVPVPAEAIATDGVDVTNLTPDYRVGQVGVFEQDSNQTFTTTSFTTVLTGSGVLDLADRGQNSTLKGRYMTLMKNDTSNETTTSVPRVYDQSSGFGVNIAELEVSVTSTSLTFVDSGWTTINSPISGIVRAPAIRCKVSGGTGAIGPKNTVFMFAGAE